MQKINLADHLRKRDPHSDRVSDMVSYTLIHAITAYRQAHDGQCPDEIKPGVMKTDCVEVEFKLNGVELDFEEFLNHISKAHDEYVAKKALEIVEERCNGIMAKMEKMTNDACAKFREELGITESGG